MSDFKIQDGILKKYNGSGGDVVIPDSVTSIGKRAFVRCSSLTSVVIPDSVTSIGERAFYGCSSLTSVVIPDGVTSIGEYAFFWCSSLTSVVIPDSVTSIGNSAFRFCGKLADENGFVTIRNILYSYYGNGGDIVIPDGVTSIGEWAFSDCSGLTSVVIPDTVRSIGERAFYDCNSLTSIVIPNSVTSIEEEAFEGMEGLILFSDPMAEKLKLSSNMFNPDVHILTKNITSIPVNFRAKATVDFAEDERFKDVDRASYLKYIKSNAAKLIDEAMTHPALLALMCREMLIAAKNVEAYTEAAQKTGNAELIAMMLDYSGKISEKDKEKVVKAKEKQDEEVFDRMVQRQDKVGIEGLKFVVTGELRTFAKRDDLKKFIESKGAKLVGSISSNVDYLIMNDEKTDSEKRKRCEELGIEIIDENKFNELSGRAFEIENGILTKYTGSGGDVVIHEYVTSIGDLAFSSCISLTSVAIPDSVTSIGAMAFYNCSSLTSVVIPDGVTSIGWNAIGKCISLTSVVIPDSVTSIGYGAFLYCNNLTIHAHEGSYAAQYAKENNIELEII